MRYHAVRQHFASRQSARTKATRGMNDNTLRILMADDHPIVLAGLKALVQGDPGLQIVGEARDGRTALRLAMTLRPDVAVLDISMPEMNGLEVARDLLA